MKKLNFILSVLILFISSNIYSQTIDTRPAYTFSFEANGSPNAGLNYIYQYTDVKGSAFINDNWEIANVVLNSGYVFKSVKIKMDAQQNKFIFNRNDSSFELPDNVKSVIIFPNTNDATQKIIYNKGIQINAQVNANKFIQVIAEGKISLYKYFKKDIEEYNEYGNATNFKRFVDMQQYYIYMNGEYNAINISKKNFDKTLKAKNATLDAFIKQKDLSGKDEKEWVLAINYYNSLP